MSESGLRVSQLLPVRFENMTEATRRAWRPTRTQSAGLPGFVWAWSATRPPPP